MARTTTVKSGVTVWAPPGTYKVTLPPDGGMLLEPYTEPCKPEPPEPGPEPPDPGPEPPEPGPEPPEGELLRLIQDYGCAGDGRTDDTDRIQRACDDSAATGKWVVPGEREDGVQPVFIINQRGTMPFQNIRCRVGVKLRDGVKIDGMGACEFKMGSNQFCYMFTNADHTNGNKNIHMRRMEWNGHRRAQPARPTKASVPSDAQENGGMGVFRIEDCTFEDIYAWNCQVHSMRNWHAKRCTYKRLISGKGDDRGNDADSWSFGQDGKECVDCHIEDIYAEDCENATYSNKQGNNVIGSTINCTYAGTISGVRCGGGFKIQGRTRNTKVAKSYWIGGPKGKFGTRNSGLKLQGNQNSNNERDWVDGITVDEAYSENCQSEGLRFSHAKNCLVKKATMVDCAKDDAGAVVFREVCHDCGVEDLTIKNSHRFGIEARMPDVHRIFVKKLDIDGCVNHAVQHSGNGTLTIDEATMRNVQGRHANVSRGKVVIKLLRADKNLSISGNVEVGTFERI